MRRYSVNEMFYSLQGEGVRAGTANVFVRFAGCNLRCNVAEHGFDCDTDFEKGDKMTAEQIYDEVERLGSGCKNVIFTGGEPALQLDEELLDIFADYHKAVESNGTRPLPSGLDWVCISPKPPDPLHEVYTKASEPIIDELKYVLGFGAKPPQVVPLAENYLVSPAYDGDKMSSRHLATCINFVKENPKWRMSVQQHKQWNVR